MRRPFPLLLPALLPLTFVVGCGGPEVVRGSQDPSVDRAAMSTSLDREDIQRMLSENLNNLRLAPIMTLWRSHGGQDTVAIAPFQNDSDQHIDSQLEAILSETEQWLVDSNVVTVIARERQTEILREIEGQQHPIFNPAHVAQYGQQLGAKYFVTGKVQTSDERTEDARRVQYFFYMQVIEVATGAIRWEHRAFVTKAIR
jgi:TolB-like protein